MDPLFQIPEDLGALDAAGLQEFIDETVGQIDEIADSPETFVTAERSSAALREELSEAVEAVKEARELLTAFETAGSGDGAEAGDAGDGGDGGDGADGADGGDGGDGGDAGDAAAADDADGGDADEALAADVAALADEARTELETEPKAAVVASAAKPRRRPARSRAAAPPEDARPTVALTAAAGASDLPSGYTFLDPREIADAMVRRHRNFTGILPEGHSEKFAIAVADWRDQYPEGRTLGGKDEMTQEALVASVVDEDIIRRNFQARREAASGGALVASGGLCAPVTPYYGLQMISVADRPVRAALPSFNADRGGIKAARPASLASITTGVGAMTVAQDAAGGTAGTKTCQSVDCPAFVETDVEILFHCLRFGNLGARTFPERVAQWNNLVLAAHARLGERTLLTGIDTLSTSVTAASLGLGASADLLSQILVAAAGMRSRHRMDPEAVLRLLLPRWVLDLLVSDVYRSQFGRFDMTPDKFTALLRAGNVEPSYYIDSAAGKNQEFGVQAPGVPLMSFPPTVTWYLFPEGSFLYLDGGTLELGLVRDSVLNSTNDFEIFGESFENVAFIGVESIGVTSTVCDSGAVSAPHTVLDCGNYLGPS